MCATSSAAGESVAQHIHRGHAGRAGIDHLSRHDRRAAPARCCAARVGLSTRRARISSWPSRRNALIPGDRTGMVENTPKVVGGVTPACREVAVGPLRAGHRADRAGLLDADGRDGQAAGEHLPGRQHRPGQRDGDHVRQAGPRRVGGDRSRRDQALRLHEVHARARAWAATAFRSTRTTCRGS